MHIGTGIYIMEQMSSRQIELIKNETQAELTEVWQALQDAFHFYERHGSAASHIGAAIRTLERLSSEMLKLR